MVKKAIRSVATLLLGHSDVDLRTVRMRLRQFEALGSELSAVFSAEDCPGQPSLRLIELALAAACRAKNVALRLLAERRAPPFVHLWPGEHYRLLHAIVAEIQPRLVLEVGTYTGMSALAMLSAMPAGSEVVTIDIIPWDQIAGSLLLPSDFSAGRFRQLVCDLGSLDAARSNASLLRSADIILVDASKDGVFEYNLVRNFDSIGLKPGALVIFDDIRFWNMLKLWRQLDQPKLDLTSFGHWSGTGLVDWYRATQAPA